MITKDECISIVTAVGMARDRGLDDGSIARALISELVEERHRAVSTTVYIPGSHSMPPDGEYVEIGCSEFVSAVLSSLPSGALYRRGGTVGEIDGQVYAPIAAERMRSVVDASLRLVVGKTVDGEAELAFRTCSRDLASLICASATVEASPLRELLYLATHPVYVGPNFERARPGWNPVSGTYLACRPPDPLHLEAAREVLDDLVCDFPFASNADRQNYFGLLLTPILRPALNEPVPMHLIGSPIERSGKTKLAEVVLGCSVLGRPTPAMQLGEREEEREKRITALLLSGASVVHLDNLSDSLDSGALASLLTSATYQGRVLGASKMVSIPNGLTVVGTGNNVHATGELAKRVVPVILQPTQESPETRQDYRHPLLRSYVESVRPRVLGALLGLVETWKGQGMPLGSVGFGGFERWASVMGGIMQTAGYDEWLTNLPSWRGGSDDFGRELKLLAERWHERWACEWVRASEVYELAVELGVFGWTDRARTERGKRTTFGQRVLSRAVGRVIGGRILESHGDGERRRVRLAQLPGIVLDPD